ncbi:DUF4214 domain-containing protein [Massilia sp. X63]|uniref:DUF4214 domain-containing protein n=1 Tax=Massilia sp. X63 TaxID=3237285 RepID=UPI0034DD2FD8
MHKHSTPTARGLRARSALALPLTLSLALTGCGSDDPAPAAATSRTAALVASAPAMTVAEDQYATAIHHIYIAYFGRPAEPPGLAFWNRQFEVARAATDTAELWRQYRANGGVRYVLHSFSVSTESQELYPGGNAQFVEGVYRTLFNRSPDVGGHAWWTDAIDRGIITREEAALAIMVGAQGEDALVVRNKVAVSAVFYRILCEREAWILAYTGARNNELARRMLAQVDAKTDLAAFEAVVRATIEEISRSPF